MKRAALARFLNVTGLSWLIHKTIPWAGVISLNYHRIGDGRHSLFDRALWSTTAEEFDAHVRFLTSHFDVIGPGDLPDVVARRKGRHVLITFDDGYRDNYTVAFPILKARRAQATFFLTTGFLDKTSSPWWDEIAWMVRTSRRNRVEIPPFLPAPVALDEPDRERAIGTILAAYKSLPDSDSGRFLEALADATGSGRYALAEAQNLWMTWDMVREMRGTGMSIGGHTVTHPVLARMSRDQQWQEVAGCAQRLTEELSEPMRYFSYTAGKLGRFNDDTRSCLSDVGVEYSFSHYGGFRRFGDWDDYDVRRVPIEAYMTADWFQAIARLPRLFAS